MVTPLQQMSAAAKQFAIGDFSYRVKVRGCDELADLGIAFNDMADALDKTESSRASFVANVSHELKTPMTSIAGFIDGILDGTIPKEKQNYYLGLVSTEVRRLSRLVVAMLNMSKIESGEFQMKPNNYDISDQIIRILLTFEQKIEKKNIEIIGLEDLQPQYIVADPDMIYQVIYNLFDNAVKFTNEDGFIKVTLEDLGSQIRVSIKNSGAGIKAEELSRVFERFYKVDKSRSLDAKGAGLGLYIVKMMVEMHSGRIYAKSEDENTAEFVFTLPKAFTPVNKKRSKRSMSDYEQNPINGSQPRRGTANRTPAIRHINNRAPITHHPNRSSPKRRPPATTAPPITTPTTAATSPALPITASRPVPLTIPPRHSPPARLTALPQSRRSGQAGKKEEQKDHYHRGERAGGVCGDRRYRHCTGSHWRTLRG